MSENTKKVKLVCLFCNKVFAGGGIHRVKQHLAGAKGEVDGCKKVIADVQYQMIQSLKITTEKKKKLKEIHDEVNPFSPTYRVHEEEAYRAIHIEDDDVVELRGKKRMIDHGDKGKNMQILQVISCLGPLQEHNLL